MRIWVPGMASGEGGHQKAHGAEQADGQIVGAAHVAHCFEALVAHFSGGAPPQPRYPESIW